MRCDHQGGNDEYHFVDHQQSSCQEHAHQKHNEDAEVHDHAVGLHDLLHVYRQPHPLSRTDWLRIWKAYLTAAELNPAEQTEILRPLEQGRHTYQARRKKKLRR